MKINESTSFQRRIDEDISTAFRNVFSVLEPEEESFLLKSAAQHLYEAGEIIVRQNRPFTGIYVVVNGDVRVELNVDDTDSDDQRFELARLSRGDIFGEVSFVDSEPTSATVVADTDVELLVVDVDVIQSLLLSDPTFGRRFFHSIAITLAKRLRETNPRVLMAMRNAELNDDKESVERPEAAA